MKSVPYGTHENKFRGFYAFYILAPAVGTVYFFSGKRITEDPSKTESEAKLYSVLEKWPSALSGLSQACVGPFCFITIT